MSLLPTPVRPVALLCVARFAPGPASVARVMALRLGLDPLRLRGAPGLQFARLLGTARGRSFGPWEPTRWAAFLTFRSRAALDAWEATHPVARAWRDGARESYRLRLEPLQWKGAWGGQDPFAGAQPHAGAPPAGPLVVLTRARVHLRHVRTFRRAAAQVEAQLADAPGLVASVGAGETPLLHQATFSLWTGAEAVRAWAYARGEHPGVVRRTRQEGWYAEELFARLRPVDAEGTWDGVDPLARARAG